MKHFARSHDHEVGIELIQDGKHGYSRRFEALGELDNPCWKVASCKVASCRYRYCCESILTDDPGTAYLDHAGTTPYPKSLADSFVQDMNSNLLGNLHSQAPSARCFLRAMLKQYVHIG